MTKYIPLLRPASFVTLPVGLDWSYVEAPRYITTRPDLPTSQYTHGVIECRELTVEETANFDLRAVEEEQPQYRREFPDFPPEDMPAIPATFDDVSWYNNACPNFASDPLQLEIWVDYLDPAKREHEGYPRFAVSQQRNGIEVSGPSLETDSWDEVLAFIEAQRARLQELCHHRDTGRGVCADCGKFL
jgi:hypothetical protein